MFGVFCFSFDVFANIKRKLQARKYFQNYQIELSLIFAHYGKYRYKQISGNYIALQRVRIYFSEQRNL
jgi:hypothetical protein